MVKPGMPKFAIDLPTQYARAAPPINKKPRKTWGGKPKNPELVPPQHRGACCKGTKVWGDGQSGDKNPATGDVAYYCYACMYILDKPDATSEPLSPETLKMIKLKKHEASMRKLKSSQACALLGPSTRHS
jgi:hypothetical protein